MILHELARVALESSDASLPHPPLRPPRLRSCRDHSDLTRPRHPTRQGIAFNLKDWGQIFDAWAKFGNYGVWLTALPAAAALAVALVKLLVSGRVLSGGVPPPSVAAAAAAPDPPPAPAASAASTAADGKGRGHKSPARASSRAVPSAKKSASKPARGAAASATAAAAGPSGVASFDDDEQDEAAEAVPLQLKPSPRRKAKPRTPAESPRRLETRRSKSPHVLRMTP